LPGSFSIKAKVRFYLDSRQGVNAECGYGEVQPSCGWRSKNDQNRDSVFRLGKYGTIIAKMQSLAELTQCAVRLLSGTPVVEQYLPYLTLYTVAERTFYAAITGKKHGRLDRRLSNKG